MTFFLPSHSFCLPALSLTLCLATWAIPAIFTDSSHQPIWFPLPQTVTFFETILQMSGLQTTRRSSPRGHSQGFQDWPGQVCWSWWMSFKTKLGWTKCWLITSSSSFFFFFFFQIPFSSMFGSIGFSTGSGFKGWLLFIGHEFEFCFFPSQELAPWWYLSGTWYMLISHVMTGSDMQPSLQRIQIQDGKRWVLSTPASGKMMRNSRASVLLLTLSSTCKTSEFTNNFKHVILFESHNPAVRLDFSFLFDK